MSIYDPLRCCRYAITALLLAVSIFIVTSTLIFPTLSNHKKVERSDRTNQDSYRRHRRTGHRTLTSTSLARVPLGCAIRRSARLALARYRVELGGLITLMIGIISIRRYMASLREARARVPELVKLTLDILATQAALHAQDPRTAPEPWISVSQLRDDVLRDEFSPRRREDLWKRVRAIVEMNANVRASVREARTGEVSRVWEWIGHVGLLDEGVSGGARRQSGRFSLGPPLGGSPTPVLESNRRDTIPRWDEGRPIY